MCEIAELKTRRLHCESHSFRLRTFKQIQSIHVTMARNVAFHRALIKTLVTIPGSVSLYP